MNTCKHCSTVLTEMESWFGKTVSSKLESLARCVCWLVGHIIRVQALESWPQTPAYYGICGRKSACTCSDLLILITGIFYFPTRRMWLLPAGIMQKRGSALRDEHSKMLNAVYESTVSCANPASQVLMIILQIRHANWPSLTVPQDKGSVLSTTS